MKKLILLSAAILALAGCGNLSSNNDTSDPCFSLPDFYTSTDTTNAEKFTNALNERGYIVNGEVSTSYAHLDALDVRNLTPKGIKKYYSDLGIFATKGHHTFILYKDIVYRFSLNHDSHIMLWDYDKNGTLDIVNYSTGGSGRLFSMVTMFDMKNMSSFVAFRKDITEYGSEKMQNNEDPNYPFEYKDGIIYINDQKLVYEDGKFSLGSLMEPTEPFYD